MNVDDLRYKSRNASEVIAFAKEWASEISDGNNYTPVKFGNLSNTILIEQICDAILYINNPDIVSFKRMVELQKTMYSVIKRLDLANRLIYHEFLVNNIKQEYSLYFNPNIPHVSSGYTKFKSLCFIEDIRAFVVPPNTTQYSEVKETFINVTKYNNFRSLFLWDYNTIYETILRVNRAICYPNNIFVDKMVLAYDIENQCDVILVIDKDSFNILLKTTFVVSYPIVSNIFSCSELDDVEVKTDLTSTLPMGIKFPDYLKDLFTTILILERVFNGEVSDIVEPQFKKNLYFTSIPIPLGKLDLTADVSLIPPFDIGGFRDSPKKFTIRSSKIIGRSEDFYNALRVGRDRYED